MQYWVKEIDAPQLAQWLEEEQEACRVIDVREFREISAGTVPNAEPMPLATLPLRASELGRKERLVIICHSGARSAQACMFLQQQGFENVFNLRGGMLAWARNQLPVMLPKAG
jgi:rhodanese-related sulfurtransferase